MPFTMEESALVQRVLDVNVSTTRSIEVRPEILRTIVAAARSGSVIPYPALVEGYTTCLKRIIKFASRLDFFQVGVRGGGGGGGGGGTTASGTF